MTRCTRCGNGWVIGHRYNGQYTEGGCVQCGEAYSWHEGRWHRDSALATAERPKDVLRQARPQGQTAASRAQHRARIEADFAAVAARQARLAERTARKGAKAWSRMPKGGGHRE